MSYIKSISIDEFRNLRNIEISLQGENEAKPRHLILTVANGSGKSSLLETFLINPNQHTWDSNVAQIDIISIGKNKTMSYVSPDSRIIHFPANRAMNFTVVKGPKSDKIKPGNRNSQLGFNFVQHLVNLQTQRAFAHEAGDTETRERLAAWFELLESHLKALYSDKNLELDFNFKDYEFFLTSNNTRSSLYHLADGHKSVLGIFAELFLQQEILSESMIVMPAVILIDEIENHLHLELQETILPFLTGMFPQHQFIVATHSPAVIASIPDAVVYDLETKKQTNSSDYHGMRYGTLMKAHFGLAEDFDIQTTKDLERLRALKKNEGRTPEETKELLSLANRLSATSHMLALEVLLEHEAEKVAQ